MEPKTHDEDGRPLSALMSPKELASWARGDRIEMDKYTIQPKRDFGSSGYWDAETRSHIRAGWIVTKAGTLATPGAGWDHDLARARRTVYALQACDAVGLDEEAEGRAAFFYSLVRLAGIGSVKGDFMEAASAAKAEAENPDYDDTQVDRRPLSAWDGVIEKKAEITNPDPGHAPEEDPELPGNLGDTVNQVRAAMHNLRAFGPSVFQFWKMKAEGDKAKLRQSVREAFANYENAVLRDTTIEAIDDLVEALIDLKREVRR